MSKPLEGIRVIDLGQIFAAPYCTLQLAYMGADVIKIEPPVGGEHLRRPDASPGGVSYSFLMLNVNKKSVTLNLKDGRGRDILMRLLEDADILVENFSSGVMESMGLGYEELHQRFPRLIYASAKGYCPGGRWANLGAMDSTVQASSGFISVTGDSDGPGTRTPATFIDMSTGSHLVSGILAALIHRGRTGKGQKVEVALADVSIPSMAGLIANELEGKPYHRMGNRHRNACPSNVYETSDGEVLIFCLTEKHWRTLVKLMRREDLLTLPRYQDHASRFAIADEVDGIVLGWTRDHSRDWIIEHLMEHGVPCAPVRSVAEVVADPDFETKGMLVESDSATRGRIKALGSPIRLSDVERPSKVKRAPVLGENTEEVLARIGIDSAEIAKLRGERIV